MGRSFFRRHDDDRQTADRQTMGLGGVVVVLLLAIAMLGLVHRLRIKSVVEDCLLARRPDCDAVLSNLRQAPMQYTPVSRSPIAAGGEPSVHLPLYFSDNSAGR